MVEKPCDSMPVIEEDSQALGEVDNALAGHPARVLSTPGDVLVKGENSHSTAEVCGSVNGNLLNTERGQCAELWEKQSNYKLSSLFLTTDLRWVRPGPFLWHQKSSQLHPDLVAIRPPSPPKTHSIYSTSDLSLSQLGAAIEFEPQLNMALPGDLDHELGELEQRFQEQAFGPFYTTILSYLEDCLFDDSGLETIFYPSADVTNDARTNFEGSVSRLRSLSQSVHPDTGIHGQILSAPRISMDDFLPDLDLPFTTTQSQTSSSMMNSPFRSSSSLLMTGRGANHHLDRSCSELPNEDMGHSHNSFHTLQQHLLATDYPMSNPFHDAMGEAFEDNASKSLVSSLAANESGDWIAQDKWQARLHNVVAGAEGVTPYLGTDVLETSESIAGSRGHKLDTALIFNDFREALDWRAAQFCFRLPSDVTIPQSNEERKAHVKALFKAFKSVELAEDNVGIVKPFLEQRHDNPRVECLCWSVLEACIRRAEAGPLVAAYDSTKVKEKPIINTFAKRFDEVVNSMKVSKTICKHLFDSPYINIFIDDPVKAANRVESNRKLNKRKGDTMMVGKQAQGLLPKRGRKPKRGTNTAESDHSDDPASTVLPRTRADTYHTPRRPNQRTRGHSYTTQVTNPSPTCYTPDSMNLSQKPSPYSNCSGTFTDQGYTQPQSYTHPPSFGHVNGCFASYNNPQAGLPISPSPMPASMLMTEPSISQSSVFNGLSTAAGMQQAAALYSSNVNHGRFATPANAMDLNLRRPPTSAPHQVATPVMSSNESSSTLSYPVESDDDRDSSYEPSPGKRRRMQ